MNKLKQLVSNSFLLTWIILILLIVVFLPSGCILSNPEKNSVILSLSKSEYEKGEKVKVTAFNGLSKPIYVDYWNQTWVVLHYSKEETSWAWLFKGHQKKFPGCICSKHSFDSCSSPSLPQKYIKIKSSKKITWTWNQQYLNLTDKNCHQWTNASKGRYQIKLKYYLSHPAKHSHIQPQYAYTSTFSIR